MPADAYRFRGEMGKFLDVHAPVFQARQQPSNFADSADSNDALFRLLTS